MNETSGGEASASRRRRIRKLLSRVALVVAAALVIAAIVYAALPRPVPVEVAAVERGEMEVTVRADGQSRVRDRYTVTAPVTGNMARLTLNVGDRIEAGAEIAGLYPTTAPLLDAQSRATARARLSAVRASYRQAQAAESLARNARDYARNELERIERVVERGLGTQQSVDRLQAELARAEDQLQSTRYGSRAARHEVAAAESVLARYDGDDESGGDDGHVAVTAPISGVVLQVLHRDAGVVPIGTPLIEIGDPTALELVVDVLTSVAVRIEPGDVAEVVRWGGERSLEAHVRHVEPRAFTRLSSIGVEEQRVNVILDIDSDAELWSTLGDGFGVETLISVWREDDVVMLPLGAAFRHGESWAAYAVEGDRAERREVELGEQNGFYGQVLSGLEAGDLVILHPDEDVVDGVEVEIEGADAR